MIAAKPVIGLRGLVLAGLLALPGSPARSQSLPVPCAAAACGASGPTSWVTSGNATAAIGYRQLRVTQLTDTATLNWQSFNIDPDHRVTFEQPSSSAVALNRIFQQDPARILGALDANGRVYLLSRNGILFGEGAQVNVAGLIASTLDLTPQALERGIALAANEGAPAFSLHRDESGAALPSQSVGIENGAVLTAEGGQIFVFAPMVTNEGEIRTPGGQTILAAGESVFLTPSTDPNLRGLLVEVGVGGEVTNGSAANTPGSLVGTIVAERGNVTLAGLIVNQLGRVSATTTVRENGSIRLQARAEATALPTGDGADLRASRTGPLTLGAGSITEVSLAASDDTSVDVNAQPESDVRIEAARVDVLRGAHVAASSGTIAITARSNLNIAPDQEVGGGEGRIFVAEGAVLDVSGASLALPMERNTVKVELRGTQLRDSPVQRDGPLRGKTVTVDTRVTGTRADGTVWQGTSLGDASGEISNVVRDVRERNLDGGVIELRSAGDVIIEEGALLDVSGGSIEYGDGFVRTSQLLRADGGVVDVSEAKPDEVYTAVVEGVVVNHERWGVTEVFQGIYGDGRGQFESGYVEGRDAGTLSILAPRFALDGGLRADTRVGPRQRLPASSSSSAGSFARVPRGGQLLLGSAGGTLVNNLPNHVTGAIRLEGEFALPAMRAASGGAFDPLRDAWPAEITVNRVRPDLLGPGAATRVSLFSNENIELPAEIALDLGVGGELRMHGANVVLAGDVTAPGGEFSVVSGPTTTRPVEGLGTVIEDTATVDLRGQWVNDHPLLNPRGPAAPLFISGGRFAAGATGGDVVLRPGSVIDVSGGAWRHTDGRLTFGGGGAIDLAVAPNGVEPFELRLGGRLAAFAFADGGLLSLTANSICIAAVDCRDAPGELSLAPQLFDGGFAAVALRSNLGGIALTENTHVEAAQQNWTFAREVALMPTGVAVDSLATPAKLPNELRHPTHLAMIAAPRDFTPFTNESFRSAAGVTIGRGARIDADAHSEIELRSSARVVVDGTIHSPGGIIDLLLDTGASLSEYLDTQGIWLTEHGVLDAAGSVLSTPNDLGLATGTVLRGGTISLRADRGFVATLAGSAIDVSGAAADLDVREGPALFVRRTVAAAGGSIEIAAAEAALIAGDLRAAGGASDVRGGSFSFTLDGNTRGVDDQTVEATFPTAARDITVSGQRGSFVLGAGAPLPASQVGKALIAAPLLNDAGFDSIALVSRSLFTTLQGLTSIGSTRFTESPTLQARARLLIDSPTFATDGGATVLRSTYVGLGSTDERSQAVAADLLSGAGTLVVDADAIELLGHSRYQGFQQLTLASRGDLRVRGIVTGAAPDSASGSLASLASIDLTAAQIYPTTLTRFAIESAGAEGSIRTALAGERRPVLSAGGALELRAPRVDHSGALVAPFGAITLAADDLVLRPGSLVATTAGGATIPFGVVQLGTDWTYLLNQLLVFDRDELPSQKVTLDSPAIDFQEGARIDLRGGGDLLGYEFIPGLGGSRDVLSPLVEPRTFAILPSLGLDLAPFDTAQYAGSALQPGDGVYLAGIGGLPGGTYQLLPARYALLPGAFLVTRVDGYDEIAPTEQFARTSGGTIIAGQLRQAGRATKDSRLAGFLVRPGTEVQQRADYDVFRATEVFTVRAARDGLAPPRLPFDGGRLSVRAQGSLSLAGSLLSAPAEGGRGAEVEISGTNLRVASTPTVGAVPGEAVIAASQLNSLGAASVLIGGTRASSAAGTRLDVSATSVEVDAGVSLVAPEIMLVARDRVTVGAGAALVASEGSAANAPDLEIVGDAAFVRAANGPQVELARTDATGGAGTLTLETGAVVDAGGSAILSASRDTTSGATLDIGESLTIGASQITLGDVGGVEVPGIVLDRELLRRLATIEDLVLSSASSIDLAAGLDFELDGNLRFDAAGLRVAAGDAAALSADEITFGNSGARPALGPVAADGELRLAAGRVSLGEGEFQVLGARRVSIDAPLAFFAAGDGALHVGGALDVATARVTGETGTDYTLDVSGALTVSPALRSVTAASEPEVDALGARLRVVADRVDIDSVVELRAGALDLTARGPDGIAIRDGGRLDLRGATAEFDGVVVGAPGGAASLAALTGSIAVDSGAEIDVGAAAVGNAGAVRLTAPQGSVAIAGRLSGGAAADFRGGFATVDAADPGALDGLAALLAAGDFTAGIEVRRRGPGDLALTAGNVLRAEHIALTADGGAVLLDGALDANGAEGGDVTVAASGELRVRNVITARGASGAGGRVALLGGDDSSLVIDASATIDVGGQIAGAVWLRAPRSVAASLLDGDSVNDRLGVAGTILGADRIDLELYAATTFAGDRTLTVADVGASSPLLADATAFMSDASSLASALGRSGDAQLRILPGVELRSTGNLTLAADWNLFPWRFTGHDGQTVPGALTLRAGGNLRFNNVLSDGFEATSGAQRSLLTAINDSWSYRLAGGADLASADPLAVVPRLDVGDVTVGPGTAALRNFVRTGTGRIDIAAGRDLVLTNAFSVIYTSGIATNGVLFTGPTQLGGRLYPQGGGDIAIDAARDIRGARGNQLVTAWLWRVGQGANGQLPRATAWTVNFEQFGEGIGALGGGDVDVAAGGAIRDLSVVIPTIGRQVGGRTPAENKLEVIGGGDLRVAAGEDIFGGNFYLGRGRGELLARGDIGSSTGAGGRSPILALSDASFDLVARGSVATSAVVDPMLLPQSEAQRPVSAERGHFISYAATAAVSLTSVAGDARPAADPGIRNELTSMAFRTETERLALRLYPPSLRAIALRGDIELPNTVTLTAAPKGNVELFALDDLRFAGSLLLSDAERTVLPSVTTPVANLAQLVPILGSARSSAPGFNSSVPVHSLANQPDGVNDTAPARFVALRGDIAPSQSTAFVYLAKPGRFVAGRDINNLGLIAQNLTSSDVTSLRAGRDIRFPQQRVSTGSFERSLREIRLAGPGRLELAAGRDVTLGTSLGISTVGNLTNRALPAAGASVSITAGLAGGEANYEGMVERYLAGGDGYDAQLIAYMSARTGRDGLTKADALSAFRALDRSQQAELVEAIFFLEVRDGGRAGARSENHDYGRAYGALATMFPGSDANVDAGEENPYAGDVSLFFSRVYTLAGGAIHFLVPGGAINAGIATPPSAFGLVKAAQELGVVAQRAGAVNAFAFSDFSVNESRVFSADGDDILVWSTWGDIDAGRGAKTAISAPPPIITFDEDGNPLINFPAALTGSGIQTLASSRGVTPGDVDLYAPQGVINAGDAGIRCTDCTFGATAVLGTDNIVIGGVGIGVTPDAAVNGAALTGVSAVASSAANAAEDTAAPARGDGDTETPLADQALGFLDVIVTGFGDPDAPSDADECNPAEDACN